MFLTLFSPPLVNKLWPGRIEIVPHTKWYLKGGAFIADRVIDGWNEKLGEALTKGYSGLRANGNEAWLTDEDRKDFIRYEKTLEEKLADQRMIVLCSYPISRSSAAEIFDVATTHQLAILRRGGNWEVLETPELSQAKAGIERLNQELEQRVIERTRELKAANEKLKTEITEHHRTEESLKESHRRLEQAQRIALVGHWERDLKTGFITWSDEIYRIMGLPLQERHMEWQDMLHPEDRERIAIAIEEAQRGNRRYNVEYRIVRPDGELRFIHSEGDVVRDEHGQPLRAFGIAQDIAERKRAEEKLRVTSEHLRALSASLQSAREAAGSRIAREIHDELGSALTSLRWDLEGIEELFSEADKWSQLPTLREKIAAMLGLTDRTIDVVRRIASELRPSLLDELGLVVAIEWQAQQFQDRTGIVVQCNSPLDGVELDQEQSTAVFRIFQEALTNILLMHKPRESK